MILVANFPLDVSAEAVEKTLAEGTSSRVSVEPAQGELAEAGDADQVYVLSAVGRDRVGLVAQVSRFCCDRGINILDLASHVEDHQYTMMLQIDLSNVGAPEPFENELASFGKANDLILVLQHNDIFRATNEI